MRNLFYRNSRRVWLRSTSNITLKNTLVNGSTIIPLSSSSNTSNTCAAHVHVPPQSPLNWYSCGPTVYDFSHLGHARTYLHIDIIYRLMTSYFRLPINYAMGMTDIDDKIIKRASEIGHDWYQLAREYENKFLHDMNSLNIIRPNTILRVTEHIPDIINYIQKILDNGQGYVTNTGVYFDVQKNISTYGKLGNIPTNNDEVGDGDGLGRGKKDSRDFALWKIVDPATPHWDSPWGPGRPGWHIECSAMTHAYFGSKVDIHCGGIDLRFPHHTNEIAQSEAHNCSCDWVKYWIHTGHLYIDGLKMSKSLKNYITIENYLHGNWSLSTTTVTSEGKHPLYKDPLTAAADLRIFFLQYKYHTSLYLSDATLTDAMNWRLKIENMLQLTHSINMNNQLGDNSTSSPSRVRTQRMSKESLDLLDKVNTTKQDIYSVLADDFNTPAALNLLTKLSNAIESYYMQYPLQKQEYSIDPIPAARGYVLEMLELFGLIIHEMILPESNYIKITLHGSKSIRGSNSHPTTIPESTITPPPMIDTLVSFRGNIRNKALKSKKEIKLLKKTSSSIANSSSSDPSRQLLDSYEGHVDGIMSSCDDIRNQLLTHHGIELHDVNDQKSIWKYGVGSRDRERDGNRKDS